MRFTLIIEAVKLSKKVGWLALNRLIKSAVSIRSRSRKQFLVALE
jgi:hypothetical protein